MNVAEYVGFELTGTGEFVDAFTQLLAARMVNAPSSGNGVENAMRRTVGDQNVDIVRDQPPFSAISGPRSRLNAQSKNRGCHGLP